jgi:hypothetical protein
MDENPYKAPKVPSDARSSGKGLAEVSRSIASFAALALLSIPASLIALFATCFASYQSLKPLPGASEWTFYGYYTGLVLGGLLGSLVMAFVLFYAAKRLHPKFRWVIFALCLVLGVAGLVAVCVDFAFKPELLPEFLW